MVQMIVSLTGVAHGGYALGRVDGKVVFVTGGIPGERVEVELIREEKSFSYGRVVDVIDPSKDRVDHVWPEAHLRGIGGVDLGHLSIDAQRRWKADVIADCLRRLGKGTLLDEIRETIGEIRPRAFSDGARGTRTRVSFVVDSDHMLAMRKPGSHETVAVNRMPLALQEIDKLEVFSEAWREQFTPGETVKAVLPSDSDAVLVTSDGAWSAPGRDARNRVRESVLAAQGEYAYEVSSAGFWQAHVDAPSVLIDAVLDGAALSGVERVLELYSGAGLLTLPLSAEARHVTAVEGDYTAHRDGQANVPWRHVRHVHQKVTPRIVAGAWDVVVLDPPRDGAGIAVARALATSGVERIVYVACDPAAMSRDLGVLSPAYAIQNFEAFDLFEHTHHVECVAVLTRRA